MREPLKSCQKTNLIKLSRAEAKLNYIKHMSSKNNNKDTFSRLEQFGGGEISAIIGSNPYKMSMNIIRRKYRKNSKISGRSKWGLIFEPVAKKYLRDIEKYDIREFGSINSSMYPVSYNPDGIVFNEEDDDLRLLEIKCPFIRNKLDFIPKHYLPQIKTGMCIIPVDRGEFIQFKFRLCKIDQLDMTNNYRRDFHKEENINKNIPVLFGYIKIGDGDLDDFGNLGIKKINDLTKIDKVKEYMIYLNTTPLFPYSGMIIPFKLFEVTTFNVAKEDDYLETYKDIIWDEYNRMVSKLP